MIWILSLIAVSFAAGVAVLFGIDQSDEGVSEAGIADAGSQSLPPPRGGGPAEPGQKRSPGQKAATRATRRAAAMPARRQARRRRRGGEEGNPGRV